MANKTWTVSLNGETLHTEVSENLTYEFPRNCSSKDSKNYVVTATDSNGCSSEKTITVRGNNCQTTESTVRNELDMYWAKEFSSLNSDLSFETNFTAYANLYDRFDMNVGQMQYAVNFYIDINKNGGYVTEFSTPVHNSQRFTGTVQPTHTGLDVYNELNCIHDIGSDCDNLYIRDWQRPALNSSAMRLNCSRYSNLYLTTIDYDGYDDVNLDGNGITFFLYHPTTHRQLCSYGFYIDMSCKTVIHSLVFNGSEF